MEFAGHHLGALLGQKVDFFRFLTSTHSDLAALDPVVFPYSKAMLAGNGIENERGFVIHLDLEG